jgi:hypothetical protein
MQFRNFHLSFVLVIFQLFLGLSAMAQKINHIEYGATNHAGQNPEFKEENGFTGLKVSMDELLKSHEPNGRIYLNDLDKVGLFKAAIFLREYLLNKGIKARTLKSTDVSNTLPKSGIEIVLLPGSYFNIALPSTRTANLRNPAPMIFHQLMYGSLAHPENTKLGRLALHAEKGLRIVARHIPRPFFDPDHPTELELLKEQFNQGPFKLQLSSIEETYHDFSKKSGLHATHWAEGDVLKGEYYSALVFPIINGSCRRALIH